MKHDEKILEDNCRQYARLNGWIACKLESNGHKGIPDDLFISPDERYFLIEFKKDTKQKPRPEQLVWLSRLPKTSYLVSSFTEFCKVLSLPLPI